MMILSVSREDIVIKYGISKREDILAEEYELLEKLSLESNVIFYYNETLSKQNEITLSFSEESAIKKDTVNLIIENDLKNYVKDKVSSNFFSLRNLPKFLRSLYKE